MTGTIPVELITLSGEHRISELEDIDALMRLYKPKVFRFVAFSVTDRDAAESITQDCFLKAHLSRDQFRGDCSVSTWLMRIAFNLIRDHTKSQKFRFWKRAAASAVDAGELSLHLASQRQLRRGAADRKGTSRYGPPDFGGTIG